MQAVVGQAFGPLAPFRIEIWPDAMLAIRPGMKNGDTLRAPRSRHMSSMRSISGSLPMPEPTTVATRYSEPPCARMQSVASLTEPIFSASSSAISTPNSSSKARVEVESPEPEADGDAEAVAISRGPFS